jgi:hypothetical protein
MPTIKHIADTERILQIEYLGESLWYLLWINGFKRAASIACSVSDDGLLALQPIIPNRSLEIICQIQDILEPLHGNQT